MKKQILCILVFIMLITSTMVLSVVGHTEDNFLNYLNNDNKTMMNDWIDETKLLAFDGEPDDRFGSSVSISGDYAIIGACYDDSEEGSAYIFKRNETTWLFETKIKAFDARESDLFGCSVSIDGDYAAIGAYGKNNWTGAAYVFKRNNTVWDQYDKLTAEDGKPGDFYGYSVFIDGPRLIIGAYGDDNVGGIDSGSAYTYIRGCCGWIETSKLTASDAAANDYFGYSVSLEERQAVVGAYGDDDLGTNSGSAYVFNRTTPEWIEEQKINAIDGEEGDRFGSSISLLNYNIVIGAYTDDDMGIDSGSAYIFNHNGTSWIQKQKLNALDGETGDKFGVSLSQTEDYIIIGAYTDDDMGIDSGSAYIFNLNGSTWSQEEKLITYNGESLDEFGRSVSISDNYAIIGAFYDDDMGSDSGSAYMFRGHNQPPSFPTITGPTEGKAEIEYFYNISSIDPEGDKISYLLDWDDDTTEDWIGPYPSGVKVEVNHTWEKKGVYVIRVKAKDHYEFETEWAELYINLPRKKLSIDTFLMRLFERFPNAFPIIKLLLKRFGT